MGQLKQPQQGQQQRRDGEQQQGAAGGGAAPGKIRVLIPEPQANGQRSGSIGPEQLGQIYYGYPVGGHRIEGQTQGRPERRQQQAPPDLGGAEAKAGPQPLLARHSGGVLCSERHQQQEGGLLEGQGEDEPEPGGIAQGLPVGGQLEPGEGRREQAQQPAGGGEQKGKADGKGNVGQRQQRREQPPQPADGPAVAVGQQHCGQQQAGQGRGGANPQAQQRRVPDARLGQQPLQVGQTQPLGQQLPAPRQQREAKNQGAPGGEQGAPSGCRVAKAAHQWP